MTSRSGTPYDPTASSIDARFFIDNGDWMRAPLLKGTTSFPPLPDVKNIMVTGGEGFIASWVVRHLATTYETYNIISFDKLDYCSSLNNTRMLDRYPNFKYFHGDITNAADVMRCMEMYRIDTVMHFAAQSHVDRSFGNVISFTHNNVTGTCTMLECAVEVGIKKFIHVSTDEVYGEVEKDGEDLKEHSRLKPTNPYAASKAAAEDFVNSYIESFKLPCIVVRSNNVYGPHQFPEKIIPKFVNLLERKRPLIIHGNGQNQRKYLYAGDAADAFDTILHKGQTGEIYNVGSYDEYSNLELSSKLLRIYGLSDEKRWIEYVVDRPFNDKRYAVDGTKLRSLGWIQKTSFDEGLQTTVQWYRDFPNWWGDIANVLSAYPEVKAKSIVASSGVKDQHHPSTQNGMKRSIDQVLTETNGNIVKQATAGALNSEMKAPNVEMKKRKIDMVA